MNFHDFLKIDGKVEDTIVVKCKQGKIISPTLVVSQMCLLVKPNAGANNV
jgi:hypothetical protein